MIRQPWAAFVVCAIAVFCAGLSAQSGSPAQEQPWPPAGVSKMDAAGVQPPTVVKDRKPDYTKSAMDAGIEGAVELEAVVGTNGRVGEVRVVRSLDKVHGLDQQALKALKDWEFRPGRKDGKAIPVLVHVEMTFALRR